MLRQLVTILALSLLACGGSQSGTSATGGGTVGSDSGDDESPTEGADTSSDSDGTEPDDGPKKRGKDDAGEFDVKDADKSSRPAQATLKPTDTEAAIRFFVEDKDKGPIEGIVISLTSPAGKTYYTKETDADGFAEVLVPIGTTYDLVYLSLGRKDIAAKVDVANKPRLNLKLTMRYKREDYGMGDGKGLVLENVTFASGKATLIGDSHRRLDAVVEYMTHKKSVHIEIAGHTDNVGGKKANKRLSQRRADAVRKYLISKGIDGKRIKAVGYGDEKPIAPNTSEAGRAQNRRIEAKEM